MIRGQPKRESKSLRQSNEYDKSETVSIILLLVFILMLVVDVLYASYRFRKNVEYQERSHLERVELINLNKQQIELLKNKK